MSNNQSVDSGKAGKNSVGPISEFKPTSNNQMFDEN